MAGTLNFQWQNEILCKTIYPMREVKLRDFLVYYKEVDLWAEYKNRDISTLKAEAAEYEKGMEDARITEFKIYSSLKKYFMTADVRGYFLKYKPIDETSLAEIHKIHQFFITAWPKDMRGERSFIIMRIDSLKLQIGFVTDRIKYLKKYLLGMAAGHPNYEKTTTELKLKEGSSLPMLMDEMDKLRDLEDSYNKLEQPKKEWYEIKKKDPNFQTTEEEFILDYRLKTPVTVRDIVRLKAEQYAKTLQDKDQYQLLMEIRARFEKEPQRFPLWLQYMVVHFSGMRYQSAHSSWADPKDLLVRLRLAELQKEQLALSDADVAAKCKEKLAQYDPANTGSKPKLAAASEKVWKDRIAMHMQGVRANGPQSRRNGLAGLTVEEVRYEYMSLTTEQALAKLEAMKSGLPAWAWKMIVQLTSLRVNYVNDKEWETPTAEEQAARAADKTLGPILTKWKDDHMGSWRPEHRRSQEVIVSRAVCNETAEHIQHVRGNAPTGGLTENAAGYFKLYAAKTPGVSFIRPKSAADYKAGASIFWLRFVNNEPSEWQVAKPVEDANGAGLLPKEFLGKHPEPKGRKNAPTPAAPWTYKPGVPAVRTRTVVDANKQRSTQTQWLRWIHEATVAEVAETADGTYVYTFETSLPSDDRGTSCLGMFRNTLNWHLSDGTEDNYNRSFVAYMPEGQVPLENLKGLMDWNKIILK